MTTEAMTAEAAAERGRDAAREGRSPFPVADPAIAAEIAGAAVGEKTHLLVAWARGWDEANAAAEVDL